MLEAQDPPRVLRLRQVEDRVGLSRATIYNRLDAKSPRYDPTFPRPFSLGNDGAGVGWLESEISDWIRAQAAKGWGARTSPRMTDKGN